MQAAVDERETTLGISVSCPCSTTVFWCTFFLVVFVHSYVSMDNYYSFQGMDSTVLSHFYSVFRFLRVVIININMAYLQKTDCVNWLQSTKAHKKNNFSYHLGKLGLKLIFTTVQAGVPLRFPGPPH